jgi:hypothetical protein
VTTSAERGETVHWGELEGVSIDFPIVVDEMNSATLVYTVPHAAAAALLPGDAFEVAETAPGSESSPSDDSNDQSTSFSGQ